MDAKKPKPPPSLNAYRRTDVVTANRETLLLMMYAGAIRFLKTAIAAMEKGDLGEKTKFIMKTQDIVNELRATLNFEIGGEIAKNLEMLYAYVAQRLIDGTVDKDPKPLNEALSILQTLNDAWEQAIATLKKEKGQVAK